MNRPKRRDAPEAKPTPVRVTSVSTERTRRRVRDVEQPIINITLQPDERRVFSVVEAAAVLGISRSKLYEFIAAGELRSIRIGRLRKIPVAVIDEFITSRDSGASRPDA
jgi:excisionase family DNA binding protein